MAVTYKPEQGTYLTLNQVIDNTIMAAILYIREHFLEITEQEGCHRSALCCCLTKRVCMCCVRVQIVSL